MTRICFKLTERDLQFCSLKISSPFSPCHLYCRHRRHWHGHSWWDTIGVHSTTCSGTNKSEWLINKKFKIKQTHFGRLRIQATLGWFAVWFSYSWLHSQLLFCIFVFSHFMNWWKEFVRRRRDVQIRASGEQSTAERIGAMCPTKKV